jgi:hypothetical protein
MRWERDCSSLEEVVSELLHKADPGGELCTSTVSPLAD